MKKISVLLLIFLVLTVSSVSANGGNEKKRIYNIGVVLSDGRVSFQKNFVKHAEDYLDTKSNDAVRYNLSVVDTENNVSVQNSQIEKLITEADAVICFPVNREETGNLIKKIGKSGSPCVLIGNSPDTEDVGDYANVCFIESDFEKCGELMAEVIDRVPGDCDANGDGVISCLLIRGEGTESDFRGKAAIAFLEENGKHTECVLEKSANWQRDNAREICQGALQKFGKGIDVVICDNDDMALGVLESIESAGRKVGRDIFLIGCDADDDALSVIKSGRMTGTVLNDVTGQSETACDTIISMLKGDEVEKKIVFEYQNICFI